MTSLTFSAKIVSYNTRDPETEGGGLGNPCNVPFLFDSTATFVEYSIKVAIVAPADLPYPPIVVKRRFSEFRKLHDDIKDTLDRKRIWHFPSRAQSFFKSAADDEFVVDRMVSLQAYLNGILLAPIEAERVAKWEDPLVSFLSLGRLMSSNSAAQFPDNVIAGGDGGGGGGGGAAEGGGDGKAAPAKSPQPPAPPPWIKIRAAAALKLTAHARGFTARSRTWALQRTKARPMYVSLSHVSGYARNAGSSYASSFYSYSAYVVVTVVDPETGQQLSCARTATRAGSSDTSWDWDLQERLLLPAVKPGCTLFFTVCDQCSIGRDNFLGQASVNLGFEHSKHLSAASRRRPPPKKAVSAVAGLGARVQGVFAKKLAAGGGAGVGGAGGAGAGGKYVGDGGGGAPFNGGLLVKRSSGAGAAFEAGGLGGSSHGSGGCKHVIAGGGGDRGRPVSRLDLTLGDQKQNVWLTKPRDAGAKDSLGGSSHGLGGSNHGVLGGLMSGGLGGSNHGGGAGAGSGSGGDGASASANTGQVSYDKSRAWDMGELSATLRWCPLSACIGAPLVKLSEPTLVSKPKWLPCFVVLTPAEILVYAAEGDAKPQKRRAVMSLTKCTGTSCQVVAPLVAVPSGMDPWDSVLR